MGTSGKSGYGPGDGPFFMDVACSTMCGLPTYATSGNASVSTLSTGSGDLVLVDSRGHIYDTCSLETLQAMQQKNRAAIAAAEAAAEAKVKAAMLGSKAKHTRALMELEARTAQASRNKIENKIPPSEPKYVSTHLETPDLSWTDVMGGDSGSNSD